MKIRNELVLRAISSFIEADGFAHFSYINLNPVGKNDSLKPCINDLIETGYLEDLSENGYCRKMKVNTPLDCPDFIFNPKFDLRICEYLLERGKEGTEKKSLNREARKDLKLNMLGFDLEEILTNATIIHNKISTSDNCELIYSEHGYKVKRILSRIYHCQYCGTEDPAKFYASSGNVCKDCIKRASRTEIPLEEKLLKRSKSSANSREFEHNITVSDIKEQLEKQHYRCYYSGIEFGDNFNDKYTYPTIDRIDSTQGYVKGNICICTFFVNMMKNNASIKRFKDVITKIYNNMENF